MASKPTHIVDASALIAYFKDELGSESFAELLRDDRTVLAIHAANMCEVYYNYLRADGLSKAEEAWTKASEIVAIIEKLDPQFVKRIGRWKVSNSLGIADAIAAAQDIDMSADADGLRTILQDQYHGAWGSEQDYAENMVDDIGGIGQINNPEFYFDWEKFTRDLFINDYSGIDQGGQVHVFSNY